MPKIELINVTKRWGNFYAVEDLNLVIDDNSFVTLLGPSGCGKTTTLRMIAGLETPTSGKIIIGDTVVFDSEKGINIPASKRKVGFLFQNYALWPNMTVYENISFGLKNIKENLPTIDFEIKTNRDIIYLLNKYDRVIGIIENCKNNEGKIDLKKVYLKLVDKYNVSLPTAKKVCKLICNKDKCYIDKYIETLSLKIEKAIEKYNLKGINIDEKSQLIVNNEVVVGERSLSSEEIDLAVRRVARVVKVGMFMDRYPAELSGGQQQRVAIARTLAPEPQVLFMDEPLSNLDAKLRLEMRYELQRLHVETGSTFVYVTHDQTEAMTLATKICLLNNGLLQQYDEPLTVYNKPSNTFVADFIGNPSINFINATGKQSPEGEIFLTIFNDYKVVFKPNEKLELVEWYQRRNKILLSEAALREQKSKENYVEKINKDELFNCHIAKVNEESDILAEEHQAADFEFVIGIRPEFIGINKGYLKGEIYGVLPTGMEVTLKLKVDEYLLTSVIFGGVTHKIGKKVNISFEGNDIALFDRVTGKLITTGSISKN